MKFSVYFATSLFLYCFSSVAAQGMRLDLFSINAPFPKTLKPVEIAEFAPKLPKNSKYDIYTLGDEKITLDYSFDCCENQKESSGIVLVYTKKHFLRKTSYEFYHLNCFLNNPNFFWEPKLEQKQFLTPIWKMSKLEWLKCVKFNYNADTPQTFQKIVHHLWRRYLLFFDSEQDLIMVSDKTICITFGSKLQGLMGNASQTDTYWKQIPHETFFEALIANWIASKKSKSKMENMLRCIETPKETTLGFIDLYSENKSEKIKKYLCEISAICNESEVTKKN